MSSAAVIARNLGGQRQGHNWRCSCPRDCGYMLSLSDGDDGKLLVHCFGGCEFDEILVALVEYGLLDDADSMDGPVYAGNASAPRRRDDAARTAHAIEIYNLGTTDERVETYLRSRSISVTSTVLRFSEHVPHRLGIRLPAMLAPIVDVRGEQIGTHATFLRTDGSGKAHLPKEFQRECRGVIRGGAIRLSAYVPSARADDASASTRRSAGRSATAYMKSNGSSHDPECELLICEGVETSLAAMQLFRLPGWSVAYGGNLRTIELPPAVRHIIIAADNDASGAGQRNAMAAYKRWTGEGKSVRIVMPPGTDTDFNDLLTSKGRS
jgi:putative DNA primase/helicase